MGLGERVKEIGTAVGLNMNSDLDGEYGQGTEHVSIQGIWKGGLKSGEGI